MTLPLRNSIRIIFTLIGIGFFFVAHSALAATYYVDATGGSDGNTGTSTDQAWQTVGKVNGLTCGSGSAELSPGDSVLFKRGEVWREQLTVPCSGTVNLWITFSTYGSGSRPVLMGSNQDNGTGWSGPDGNGKYYKPYVIQPYWLMRDGQVLTATGTLSALGADAWLYSGGNLYIGSNPTGHTFEVSQRKGVDINNQQYVRVSDFSLRYFQGNSLGGGADGGGISVPYLSDHISLENNDIQYGTTHGIAINGATNINVASNTINYIETRQADTSGDGILILYDVSTQKVPTDIDITGNIVGSGPDTIDRQGIAAVAGERIEIQHNTIQSGHWGIDLEPNQAPPFFGVIDTRIHDNSIIKTGNIRGYIYNGGIAASGPLSSGVKIYNNQITLDDSYLSRGIWVRDFGGNGSELFSNKIEKAWTGIDVGTNAIPTAKWFLYRNKISAGLTNRLYGINLSRTQTLNVVVNNNVIEGYDNAIWNNSTSGGVVARVYNNSLLNYGQNGVYVGNCNCHDVAVEGNIFSASPSVKHIRFGPSVVANVENNLYTTDGNYFIWNGIPFANFATWQATSSELHGVVADPLFVSAAGNDFSLRYNSPSIDAGSTTALHTATSTDYLGNPIYGTPDIGAIEYQPPYTIGSDAVPATGAIRLYADGKFRERVASSSTTTAPLTVAPQGGWGSGDYRAYMDLAIDTWTQTDKSWTATSSIAIATVFTIASLTPNAWYDVAGDGVTIPTLTGASCTGSVCKANGSGVLALTYSGGWSTHTFSLTLGTDPNPATSSGGGALLNGAGGGSSKKFDNDNVTASTTASTTATTVGTSTARSTGNPAPCNISATVLPTGDLSISALLNLLFSLGIIPADKQEKACEALRTLPTRAEQPTQPFTRSLTIGDRGEDVRRLQVFLNTHGFAIANGTDLGSPGNETEFFGLLTFDAVKRFQTAYATEILKPVGLSAPSGFFGASSIRKANALLRGRLREGAKSYSKRPRSRSRVDLGALARQHPEPDLALGQVLDRVDEMAERAAKAVKLPDDKDIAGA